MRAVATGPVPIPPVHTALRLVLRRLRLLIQHCMVEVTDVILIVLNIVFGTLFYAFRLHDLVSVISAHVTIEIQNVSAHSASPVTWPTQTINGDSAFRAFAL